MATLKLKRAQPSKLKIEDMGIKIGIGRMQISHGGGTGIDWSSYWATRTPSGLVLTVMSDSIQVDWTDAAVAADGLRIYLDGVEVDTVAYGVETYTITGLTVNTEYVVSLVAYFGTNESTALTDTVTTPVIIAFADEADGALPVLTGATWAVATGKALNTPTVTGLEKLTDTGLEDWTDSTHLVSWDEYMPLGGSVNQESTVIHGGTYAARLDVDAGGHRVDIQQNPLLANFEFYNISAWVRASLASKVFTIKHENQLNPANTFVPSNSAFGKTWLTSIRKAAGSLLFQSAAGNANTSFYVDDVSAVQLTKTTLYATVDAGRSDVTTKSYWTKEPNTLSGVIMNIDNVANPQNWVAFVTNGKWNNTFLIKCVAGTISQVVSTGTTGDTNSQLIELRKSGTTYKQFIGGVQLGADQTIADATIVDNTIHGLFSTYVGNVCDRFYCGDLGDVIEVPDSATISDYYKYVSSGDTLSLASGGTYTWAAGVKGFETLPSGTATRRTTINCNGSTITGGESGIFLNQTKSYFEFNDLELADQTNVGVLLGTNLLTGAGYITFNNVWAHSNVATYIDTFKNQYNNHHLEFNDCEAGPCVGGSATCDGFEDWDSEDVVYNNCIAHGFQNGAELLNNGHGFETYAQNAGEVCRRITYNNCHAYDCRVGFSCEGGPLSAAHENIRAINCTTATIDLYDASGVDGATLLVTAGTLLNRNGNVTEI